MAITRKFRETVLTRAQGDARFRAAMLTEAINDLLAGELDTGKSMLRDYVNATISFEGLAKATPHPYQKPATHAPRQPDGGRPVHDLKALQKSEHIKLTVTPKRAA